MTLDDIATCALTAVATGSLLAAAVSCEKVQQLRTENARLRDRLRSAWAHTGDVVKRLTREAQEGRPSRGARGRFTRRADGGPSQGPSQA